MVICEKGNGLEKRIKIQGNGRTCNLKATSGAACIHKDRDLPTQGRAHARSRGHIVVRFSWPRPPASAGWS